MVLVFSCLERINQVIISNMQVNGTEIECMGMGITYIQMEVNIKETFSLDLFMDTENISGRKRSRLLMVSSWKICLASKVSGLKGKCTEKVCFVMLMATLLKVILWTTFMSTVKMQKDISFAHLNRLKVINYLLKKLLNLKIIKPRRSRRNLRKSGFIEQDPFKNWEIKLIFAKETIEQPLLSAQESPR